MCCTQLAENTGRKISPKSPSRHHRPTWSGYIFATKACVDNQKKNLLNGNNFSTCPPQYGELRPTSGWDLLAILRHASKFQRVSRLGFLTAPTSLNGGQQNFAGCLAVSWAGTLYIHFGGSCSLTQFWHLQNSLCIQVLRSRIGRVTAWHSSSGPQPGFAAWYNEWNYGTSAESATYIWLGGYHVEHRPTL